MIGTVLDGGGRRDGEVDRYGGRSGRRAEGAGSDGRGVRIVDGRSGLGGAAGGTRGDGLFPRWRGDLHGRGARDRKRVVKGKWVLVRVDLGGRRHMYYKTTYH